MAYRNNYRRQSPVLDFFQSFKQGYGLANSIASDIEMGNVAREKPTTDTGFTQAQGDQLNAAADSGQYDVAWDPERSQYTVAPKSAPGMAAGVAPQQRQQFLGKTYDQPLDEAGVTKARQLAMAGVMEKYGDVQGGGALRDTIAARESRAKAENRADVQFGWAQGNQAQLEAQRAKETAYEDDRKTAYGNTNFSRSMGGFAKQLDTYNADMAKYNAAIEKGDTSIARPVQPVQPSLTTGQTVLDQATLLSVDIAHGRATGEQLQKWTALNKQVNDEGYVKALRFAQDNPDAPTGQIAAVFNAQGEHKIDESAIVSDKVVPGPGGMKTRVLTYKDPQGNLQTLNTQSELDMLGKGQEVFSRAMQINADKRAEESLRLQRASLGATQGARNEAQAARGEVKTANEAKAAAAVGLFKEQNPGATPAQLEAVRTGVISATPESKNAPAEVKLAQALVEAGAAPDMKTALGMSLTKKVNSPSDVYLSLMKPQNGIGAKESDIAPIMERVYGPDWQAHIGGQKVGGAVTVMPKGEADAHAEAKRAVAQGASKDQVNARLKQAGFKPL